VDREALGLALYIKWVIEAKGDADPGLWRGEDWEDWKHDRPLNPVGLRKESFLEEADDLLRLIKITSL
jgi:hypothetical protein